MGIAPQAGAPERRMMKITYELTPREVEVLTALSQHSGADSLWMVTELKGSPDQLQYHGFIQWDSYEGQWRITDFGRQQMVKNPYRNIGEGNIMATLFNDGCQAQGKALIEWGETLCQEHHGANMSLITRFSCRECMLWLKREVESG